MAKVFDILSLGSVYLDINCTSFPFTDGLKVETETVGERYSPLPGGSAVISSVVAAQLGFKPVFIGKVGDDMFGQSVMTLLKKTGIEPALVIDSAVQTNLGLNFINPQGKTISAAIGTANQSLTAEEILSQLELYVPRVSYLYLGGYFKLKALTSHYPAIIRLAHQHGVKVIMDHGRINNAITPEQFKTLKQLITEVDFYFPSEDEFCTVWECADVQTGLQHLRSLTSAVIAVKQSHQGASSIDEQGTLLHSPSFPVTPVNTIGAGDSFNAGFLSAYAQGQTLQACLEYGCATAALKISQATSFNSQDIVEFIKANTVRMLQ